MNWLIPGFVAAILGLTTEIAYVSLVRTLVLRDAAMAAIWTMILVALGWSTLALIYSDVWHTAIPSLFGHGAGTFLTVRCQAKGNEP